MTNYEFEKIFVSGTESLTRDEICWEMIPRVARLAEISDQSRVEKLLLACKFHYPFVIESIVYRKYGFTKEEEERIETVLEIGRLMVAGVQLPPMPYLEFWNDYIENNEHIVAKTITEKWNHFWIKWLGVAGDFLSRKSNDLAGKRHH